MHYWFYRQGRNESDDGYYPASPALASILQSEGREVWPKRSKDPVQDYRDWVSETEGEA